MIHVHRGIIIGDEERQKKLWQLRLSQWVVLVIFSCLLISLLVTVQKKLFAPDATDGVTLLIVLSCASAAIAIIAGLEVLKSKQLQQQPPTELDTSSSEEAHPADAAPTSMTDALVSSEQVMNSSYGATVQEPELRPNNQ